MSRQTPSDKSTKRETDLSKVRFSREEMAAVIAEQQAEEIERGKRHRDKDGNPVIVMDRPIDL